MTDLTKVAVEWLDTFALMVADGPGNTVLRAELLRVGATGLLRRLSEHGVVRLSDSQDWPEYFDGNRPRRKAFRDAGEAGFRKVEPLLPEGK